MIHGFTEKDWNDYIEGTADELLRDRIEAHLIGCLSCWEFHDQMAQATEALRATGETIRNTSVLQDRQLQDGLRKVFARIQAKITEQPAIRPHEVQVRLNFLEAVLAPMCGSQTASKALSAAAISSPARTLNLVTTENWDPFLERLTSIAAVMCGKTGADLIRVGGRICFE